MGNPASGAIALALAEAGADVAVTSAGTGADEVLAVRRVGNGVKAAGRATFVQAWDVTSSKNVQVGMRQLVSEFGAPTILVTAPDAILATPITKTRDVDYQRVIDINLNGVYYTCRQFLAELPEDSVDARIINVVSILGERGVDNLSAYAAAKGGVISLTRAIAQEYGRRGVTANCISTGWMTDTPGRGPDELEANLLLRFIPMRRFGEPSEIAALAVLLASPAAGYVSGCVLHVDGGATTHR